MAPLYVIFKPFAVSVPRKKDDRIKGNLSASGMRPFVFRPPREAVTNINNALSVSTEIKLLPIVKSNSSNSRLIYEPQISMPTFAIQLSILPDILVPSKFSVTFGV